MPIRVFILPKVSRPRPAGSVRRSGKIFEVKLHMYLGEGIAVTKPKMLHCMQTCQDTDSILLSYTREMTLFVRLQQHAVEFILSIMCCRGEDGFADLHLRSHQLSALFISRCHGQTTSEDEAVGRSSEVELAQLISFPKRLTLSDGNSAGRHLA